jgi:transposase
MQEMSRKRRNHSPEFKSKVALAAVKGDQTLSELSQQYGINSNLIVKWKKQLIEQSSEVFASGKGLAPDRESEIQGLQAKIGQLTMENDFLAKVLGR